MKKVLIAGAGFSGATVARLLAERGYDITIIDKRDHIAGNAYDSKINGILVHHYGAHIFHTSNKLVWDFVNRFAEFNNYQHHVRASYKGKNYSMPISLDTISQFLGGNINPTVARNWVKEQSAEITGTPKNLEEKAISLIGRPLYEAFIKEYTWKQWKTDPKDLPESIITRLPVRYNFNTRYFNDRFEGMPIGGYSNLIWNMLNHERIKIQLNTDFFEMDRGDFDVIYYCGPIDHLFSNVYGKLGWRSVEFQFQTHTEIDDIFGTSVTNYSDADVEWTRAIEFKHFYPEEHRLQTGTVVAFEKSMDPLTPDEYYYPINTKSDRELLSIYQELAVRIQDKILLGGRLGKYKYLDMHQAIAIAFDDANTLEGML